MCKPYKFSVFIKIFDDDDDDDDNNSNNNNNNNNKNRRSLISVFSLARVLFLDIRCYVTCPLS